MISTPYIPDYSRSFRLVLVFLNNKNIDITRLLKKLNNKRFKLFEIKEFIDISYRLALSNIIRIHNVFYSKLLILATQNLLFN